MEDYAMRRREYVQEIRASFDQPSEDEYGYNEMLNDGAEESSFLGFKIRLAIAMILFFIVLFCKYNAYPIFGFEVTEIIDMIRDNQYYTFLQNYDILRGVRK